MADNYNIPLGIDPKGFFATLDQMQSGLNTLANDGKAAARATGDAMGQAAKQGDNLTLSLTNAGNQLKNLKGVAADIGKSIGQSLNASDIGSGFTDKINQFNALLKQSTGKGVNIKFDVDATKLEAFKGKVVDAAAQMEHFETVITSSKALLQSLSPNTQAFQSLDEQIQLAEGFLQGLREAATEVQQQLATPPPVAGIQAVGDVADVTSAKTKSLRQTLREMREELAQMELAGQKDTDKFNQLALAAGRLKDQIGDTSSRINKLASDTRYLDAGVGAVRALSGAFAAATGAIAVFGGDNEELQKTLVKVQGAMAILMGVQELATALNKDSALRVVIDTYARKANTEAIAEQTVALAGEAVATEVATTATESFTAALLLNPITLIIAAFAACAFAIYEFSKSEKSATEVNDDFNKSIQRTQDLLQSDIAILNRRTAVDVANAQLQDAKQSQLTSIAGKGLQARLKLEQQAANDLATQYNKELADKQTTAATLKATSDAQNKAEETAKNTANDIEVKYLEFQKQKQDEEKADNTARLSELKSNYEAENAIRKATLDYARQIINLQLSELKDGKDKEIAILKEATKEKIEDLDKQSAIDLQELEFKRREIALDDGQNASALAAKKEGYAKELALTQTEIAKRAQLKVALLHDEAHQQQDIIYKDNIATLQLLADADKQINDLQKDGHAKKLEQIDLEAEAERTTTQEKYKDLPEVYAVIERAIGKKRDAAVAEENLTFQQQLIDNEKNTATNVATAIASNAGRTLDAINEKNIAIAKINAEAAQKQLDLLLAAGKKESDVEVQNAKALVQSTKDALDDAVQAAGPVTWAQALFGGTSTTDQIADLEKNINQGLSSLKDGITSATDAIIASYKARIDAQKAVVQADDDAISALQTQLATETALKDKGRANDVAGVQKQLAAKQAQRTQDLAKEQQYQKDMAKAQKAQLAAQSALELSNLVLASTSIMLKAVELGGPFGVPVAIASIALMFGAFVASKAKAAQAINQQTFEKGGVIDGRTHTQGGQKYRSVDGTGGIVELEAGEHVTNKNATAEYLPLLDAINKGALKGMSDAELHDMLDGLGIHLQSDIAPATEEASHEHGKMVTRMEIGRSPGFTVDTRNMESYLRQLAQSDKNKTTVYEENGYLVTVSGSKTTRIRKR